VEGGREEERWLRREWFRAVWRAGLDARRFLREAIRSVSERSEANQRKYWIELERI
jgi:hypothetical protein